MTYRILQNAKHPGAVYGRRSDVRPRPKETELDGRVNELHKTVSQAAADEYSWPGGAPAACPASE